MIKRTFLSLLITLSATLYASAYDFAVDGIYYQKTSSNTVSVVSLGSGTYSGDIIIPSEVSDEDNSYLVTSIREEAFEGCYGLNSVNIPNTVKTIGLYAFMNCYGLKSITIPESVTTIEAFAFAYCINLTSVTIEGNSEISFGPCVFPCCSSLKEFYGNYASEDNRCLIAEGNLNSFAPAGVTYYNIPDNVISIGSYAFNLCSGLTSVNIPDSVTSIGQEAFNGCNGLTSVSLPEHLTLIDTGAFADCTGLASIRIPDSVVSICSSAFKNTALYRDEANWENGVLYIDKHLIEAKDIISGGYLIKDDTLSIADYAFYDCKNLTSVTIPDSVVSLGLHTFMLFPNITIICKKTDPSDMYYNGSAFVPTGTNCTLFVPQGSKELYASASHWENFSNIFGIGDIDKDGNIAVGDITSMIDMILSGDSKPYADINGNNTVNVGDISALIDIILGE